MQVAVIISSALGLPALRVLAAQGAVVGVAVPLCAPLDETEQFAQLALGLGLPVTRLRRVGLATALQNWLMLLSLVGVQLLGARSTSR